MALAESIYTKLKLRKGFEFKVVFDGADVPELIVDEIKTTWRKRRTKPY
jgi:hypothetical protein